MNDEQVCLINLLQEAVSEVYQEDPFLFRNLDERRKGMEQSFVFRVGVYLHERLKKSEYCNFDLDSEYNKDSGNLKTTEYFKDGLRPDLILHKRWSNDYNKLAVEFKGWWVKNKYRDIKKLKELTSQSERYKYDIGVLVIIGQEEAAYEFYAGGRVINE